MTRKFSAVMSLPISAKGLVKSESRGRSSAKISASGQSTDVKIEAEDMVSFRATVNSVLRDLNTIDAVSRSAGKSKRKP